MHDHWPQLRKAIEHAIHTIEHGEQGGYRVHTRSATRIAQDVAKHSKGPEKEHARQVEAAVHKASLQIDMKTGMPHLKPALEIAKNYAKDGEPTAP